MRVYIVHPADKARRLKQKRVIVYECELKPIAMIETSRRNAELYKDVMWKIGASGVRVVISEDELSSVNGIAKSYSKRDKDGV